MERELHTNESNNIDIHSTSLERKLSLALHKRYPVIWAADNIQELVLDDKATVENVYDVLAEIEDKCVHLSKLINIEFNPSSRILPGDTAYVECNDSEIGRGIWGTNF